MRRLIIDIVRIRRANSADVPQMQELGQQAATAAHWSAAQHDALFAPDAAVRVALVADGDTSETSVIGFVVARCLADEWEIENVVVEVGSRRRGIGSLLVRDLADEALAVGVHSIILEVRESNRAAARLYESIGFIEDGRRPAYYQDPPEDALLYRLTLQSCDKIS